MIVIKQLSKDGTRTLDNGVLVYDGHDHDPTIEGPKFYKRNGWYYIFAPAGGVSTGWQLVLRSKNIYGPYERKVVMDQGSTKINGPHQGAWVDTKSGEHWFLHFQDLEAYGRIVHLQPMKWVNDWPVIGTDKDGDGKGEPVLEYRKPNTTIKSLIQSPPTSDEFEGSKPGLQWQWQANPQPYWSFVSAGKLRLYSYQVPDSMPNYWSVPNLLMQKFPAEEFVVTTKLNFQPRLDSEKTGLIVHGLDYAYISLAREKGNLILSYTQCLNADKGKSEQVSGTLNMLSGNIYLRVSVSKGASCQFSFSNDGNSFTPIGEKFIAKPGKWVGAKVGLFCTRSVKTNDSGYADFDWFRVTSFQ